MIGGINIPAVLAASLAGLGINFVWFTIIFRAPYIAGLGRTQAQLAAGPSIATASLIQFAGFLALSAGLAWLMQRTGLVSTGGGIALAVVAWISFVAAIIGPMYAYQAFSLSLFGIVSGGYLVVMLAAGAILGLWR